MTTPDTNRILADFVGHGGNLPFSPSTNRNDLAEVLGRLTDEQWEKCVDLMDEDSPEWIRNESNSVLGVRWLLTCDPAIIADAVARVVQNG